MVAVAVAVSLTGAAAASAAAPNSPPTLAAGPNAARFVEQIGASADAIAGAPVVVDPAVAVVDPDEGTFVSASVELGAGAQAGDVLSVDPATLPAGATVAPAEGSAASLAFAFAPSASQADVQGVLRSVTFALDPADDAPSTADRAVTFSVTDDGASAGDPGNDLTATTTQTVTVEDRNDAPVVNVRSVPPTIIGGGVSPSRYGDYYLLSQVFTVTSADLARSAQGQLVLGQLPPNLVQGYVYQESVGVTQTICSPYDSSLPPCQTGATPTSAFNGPGDYQLLFEGASAGDVLGDSQLTFGGNATAYVEAAPPVVVAPLLTVTDPEGDDLTSLVATLTNPQEGDVLSGPTGNEGVYNPADGTLTFDESETPISEADAQELLRQVTFANTLSNPDRTDRVVEFVVTDNGGSTQTDPADPDRDSNQASGSDDEKTVTVGAINDAPVLTAGPGGARFVEQVNGDVGPVAGVPVVVDPDLDLTDPESGDFLAASAAITAGNDAGDVLRIDPATLPAGATVDPQSGVGASLQLTFAPSASRADVLAVLRAVRFALAPANDSPATADRTVTFSVTDDGANVGDPGNDLTGTATQTVAVEARNDAPVVVAKNVGGGPIGLVAQDVNGGASTPFPSETTVSGLVGTVSDVNVSFTGFTTNEINYYVGLVVSPDGRTVLPFGHTCNGAVDGIDLTFDDEATDFASSSYPCASGTFIPSNGHNGYTPPGAPSEPYGRQLSDFDGAAPNGTWQLFVWNHNGFGVPPGTLDGWHLTITTTGSPATEFDNGGQAAQYDEPADDYDTSVIPISPVAMDPAPVAVSLDLKILDDSDAFSSAVVTLTDPQDRDVLSGPVGAEGAYDAAAGTLTFDFSAGALTLAQLQDLLRQVTFANTTQQPNETDRHVRFVVTDAGGSAQTDPADPDLSSDAASGTRDEGTVTVVGHNDRPLVLAGPDAARFVEAGDATSTPVAVDPALRLDDVDTATLQSATVQVTGNADTGDVLALPATAGYASSYDPSTSTLTITRDPAGSYLLADWRDVLRSVTFTDDDDAVSGAQRTVTFVVDDAAEANATSTPTDQLVDVSTTNDTPVLTTSDGTAVYQEPSPDNTTPAPVVVDPDVALVDADGILHRATVQVLEPAFRPFQDVLGLVGDPAVTGDITGSYDGSTGRLTLTSAAGQPDDVWQAALRLVTYADVSTPHPTEGTRTVEFRVADDAGAFDTAQRDVEVLRADRQVANPDQYGTQEDHQLVVAAPGVLLNDTDLTGNGLSAAVVTAPTHGEVVMSANGGFTYQPDADYTGADSFTYGVNGATTGTGTAVVTLDVTPVADAPSADDESYTTDEDTDLSDNVLDAGDTDADAGQTATLTAQLVSSPGHGTITAFANGAFTYRPDRDFTGRDSFTYQVTDATGLHSAPAVAEITVAPVVDVPVAIGDVATTPRDTSVDVDVLANDRVADGGTPTITGLTQPDHGTVALAAGKVTYTPATGWEGTDTFTYKVTTASGTSAPATVWVNVTRGPNRAPVADDDSYVGTEDTRLVVDAPGVLAGDRDADGDTLTVSVDTAPTKGTVALASDGSLIYVPDVDANGTDSFTYTVTDGTLSDSGRVTISIDAVDDTPSSLVLKAHKASAHAVGVVCKVVIGQLRTCSVVAYLASAGGGHGQRIGRGSVSTPGVHRAHLKVHLNAFGRRVLGRGDVKVVLVGKARLVGPAGFVTDEVTKLF